MHLRQLAFIVSLVMIGTGPTACGQSEPEALSDDVREQLIGWYEADRGRQLTILPQDKRLLAVFDWGNGAPTSVGKIAVNAEGKLVFEQPAAKEILGIEKEGEEIRAVSIIDVRFSKRCGLASMVGRYVNEKKQTMDVSLRDGQIRCSVDWGNSAPLSNGWMRADPSGKTVLKGYRWQEILELRFAKQSVSAISLLGQPFLRTPELSANHAAEKSDEHGAE